MSFDQVPVACVQPSWLSETFLPETARQLTSADHSVHLMATDSHREAEFLCNRLIAHLGSQCQVKDLLLDAIDPTLGWEALFGLPDASPVINARSECDVLVVKGGNYLPQWFLDQHLLYLRDVSTYFRVHLLLPISRSVEASHADRLKTLPVPSLKNASPDVLREFVLYSIISKVPDLRDTSSIDRGSYRNELCDLILADCPESRTRVEDALGFYAGTFDAEQFASIPEYARAVPPSVAGKRHAEPASIHNRNHLRSEFESGLRRLLELDRQFSSQCGQALLAQTHDLPDRFDSSDPRHWFIGCVSYLGCLFFDAGKKTGLSVMLSFDLGDSCGSLLRRDGEDAFQRSLRVLRTFFQHSLNPDNPDDRKTIAEVSDWFVEKCGAGSRFTRQSARCCVSAVLDGFSSTVDRLSRVIPALQNADVVVKQQISMELARFTRTMADHEVCQAIQNVVKGQGIDVDWEQVHKKYQARIVKDIKESTCGVENLGAMLVSVCEKYCYEMSRQPMFCRRRRPPGRRLVVSFSGQTASDGESFGLLRRRVGAGGPQPRWGGRCWTRCWRAARCRGGTFGTSSPWRG